MKNPDNCNEMMYIKNFDIRNPPNSKNYISKALQKYLDEKIKIENEYLFMNNVEKIQQLLTQTDNINEIRKGNISSTAKNLNKKKIIFNNELNHYKTNNNFYVQKEFHHTEIDDFNDEEIITPEELKENSFDKIIIPNSNKNQLEKNIYQYKDNLELKKNGILYSHKKTNFYKNIQKTSFNLNNQRFKDKDHNLLSLGKFDSMNKIIQNTHLSSTIRYDVSQSEIKNGISINNDFDEYCQKKKINQLDFEKNKLNNIYNLENGEIIEKSDPINQDQNQIIYQKINISSLIPLNNENDYDQQNNKEKNNININTGSLSKNESKTTNSNTHSLSFLTNATKINCDYDTKLNKSKINKDKLVSLKIQNIKHIDFKHKNKIDYSKINKENKADRYYLNFKNTDSELKNIKADKIKKYKNTNFFDDGKEKYFKKSNEKNNYSNKKEYLEIETKIFENKNIATSMI